MNIDFFDNPEDAPKSRDDVRIKTLGLYLFEDQMRVAVGFEMTKFLEPPCIEVTLINERDEKSGSLHVINANDANFSLTMHIRDSTPTDTYDVRVKLYYAHPEKEPETVQEFNRQLDRTRIGEQTHVIEA
ncbi:MAG: hypothetical protein AAF490_26905 [Chloroflexota bacterium]